MKSNQSKKERKYPAKRLLQGNYFGGFLCGQTLEVIPTNMVYGVMTRSEAIEMVKELKIILKEGNWR